MKTRRWVIAIVMLVAPLEAAARDPRVPPGRDPGGAAVALVSVGIDYTRPELAARLARDGEGEVVGWDFEDGEALPFEAANEHAPSISAGNGTALARIILAEAPGARLVPVRINPERPGSLMRAMAFVGQTPAQVVLVAVGGAGGEDWEQFREAARHFNKLLIVIPADAKLSALARAASGLTNVLIVEAAGHNSLQNEAEIIIEPPAAGSPGQEDMLSPAIAAAARAVGRAAGEAARAPELDGAGLKRAMLEQARR